MKNVVLYSILALLVIGCGSNEKPKDRVMVISEKYSVNPGDRIIKHTDDTVIEVYHKAKKKSSTVSLVSGEATIIRKK